MNEIMKAALEKRLNELLLEIGDRRESIDDFFLEYVSGERDLEDLPEGYCKFLLIGAVALYLIRSLRT